MEIEKTPGQLLLEYREKVNELRSLQINRKPLTQAQLGEEIGVTGIAIGNWERDISKPATRHLKKLIELYLREGAFPEGKEERSAKGLWQIIGRKDYFSEEWFRGLPKSILRPFSGDERQILQRALARNPRGFSLMEAIESVGLVDIENRSDKEHQAFPPEQFYDMAKHQIVITGVSTYRTFDQGIGVLHRILKAGKQLRILILHPDAEDVKILSTPEFEDRNIRFEVMYVVSIAERLKQQYPDFQIRFMNELPPFTGVMIDGDIEHEESGGRETKRKLLDQEGLIRVQPRAAYKTQHDGLILQFKKVVGTLTNPFDYFAQDLRKLWQHGERLEQVLKEIVP